MKKFMMVIAAATLPALTACGGGADDKAARNVEATAENMAAGMEAQADNMSNGTAARQLEQRAEQVEDAGERKAAEIDRNDGPTTNTGAPAGGTTTNRVESNVSGM